MRRRALFGTLLTVIRSAIVWTVAFGALAIAGCTRPLIDDDAGRRGDAPLDAATPIDAPLMDALRPDAPAVDGGALDAPMTLADAPDAPVIDTPPDVPPDVPLTARCNSLYGALPSYVFCDAEDETCEFQVSGSTFEGCREVCDTAPGGECDRAYRSGGPACLHGPMTGCGGDGSTLICVCRL